MFRREKPSLPLGPGDEAPDFALPDSTGALRRLSDFRGENVVLWFYPKARTPG
jgi:thioredoxin-dependent peroxiredoxin